LAQRARIVLAAADGLSSAKTAVRLGVPRPTVTMWGDRFAKRRGDGLTG
jgi:transposase